jgi:hypothetical protein
MAERVGFEPTCPFGQDAFEAPPLRPLRYLSIIQIRSVGPFSIPHLPPSLGDNRHPSFGAAGRCALGAPSTLSLVEGSPRTRASRAIPNS